MSDNNAHFQLVVDIGNTHSVLGVYHIGDPVTANPQHIIRMRSNAEFTSDELFLFISQLLMARDVSLKCIESIAVASVVPKLTACWQEAFQTIKIREVDYRSSWSFSLNVESPNQVGADRLANAEGGLLLSDKAMIVIDTGTATTFDLISKNNNQYAYEGGVILPGFGISYNALTQRASKLSSVNLEIPASDLSVVGKNTEQAVQSGLRWGFAAMADGMIEKILTQYELEESDVQLFATGGFSHYLKGYSRYNVDIHEDLTLMGIRKIMSL